MRKAMFFITGVIMGSLFGAAVAVLLAPASGEELRGDLQNRYIELKDEVQSAASTRRAELESKLETMRKPVKPAKYLHIKRECAFKG